jgi:cytidylate kinase
MIQDNAAMSELVVVTGPPGAGKSSVAGQLATARTPSALVPADTFFAMIKKGYVPPWLPQAHRQNEVIIEAAAAAASRLSEISFVIFEGIVGPWFLPTFISAAQPVDVHYVVLLPPLRTCIQRVRSRSDHGFSDEAVTNDLYRQFVDAGIDDRHLIIEPEAPPAQLAELIMGKLNDGSLQIASSGSP